MDEDLTFLIITSLNDVEVEHTLENIYGLAKIILVDGGARKKSEISAQESDYVKNLATKFGAEYFNFNFNYAAQSYNYGLKKVTSEYVFVLDSDERLGLDLREWILEKKYQKGSVFTIRRINYFLGEPMKYGLLRPDWNIRLFRVKSALYEDRQVHARVMTSEKIAKAPGNIHHFTYGSMESFITRIMVYSAREVLARKQKNGIQEKKGKVRNFIQRFPFQGLARFLYNYIWRLGILDGRRGFHLAAISCYYELLVVMRKKYN